MLKWIKDSLNKIWEGLLKHLGVLIAAFVVSGGYLVAINKLKEFQKLVRTIPTDYILTPLVLLLVVLGVVLRINYKQRQRLSRLETQPPSGDEESRFVTHYGVWWKIYPESEYIEDFPYCPCCQPRQKLVQTEWYPNEIYKCPKTATEVKLYDHIPREKEQVLRRLYRSYFGSSSVEEIMFREFNRLKRLQPNKDEREIAREVLNVEPLDKLPKEKVDEIFERFTSYHEIFHFLTTNYKSYKQYLKPKSVRK